MTNDPKTEAFQDLLLEQAKLCHLELQNSLKTLRAFEEIRPIRDRLDRTTYINADLLVQHVNQMIESTTRLAAASARLRGQVIHVAPGEGGTQKARFNSDTKLRKAKKGK
ncbi:MAG TPA: hypothetical protein VGG10_16845 [Rhizomicrobium sp.]|jgi:hypothetical protein